MKTAAELLNPRYEIIADYPGNEKPIGAILECPNFDNDFTKVYWVQSNDKYPHLFRKMAWWEKRNISEMPQKLIFQGNGEIIFIEKWEIDTYQGVLIGLCKGMVGRCISLRIADQDSHLPID